MATVDYRRCEKCGSPLSCDCSALQLLIVDMGDCCCVRVEQGSLPTNITGWQQDRRLTSKGTSFLFDMQFADLRAALEDKPVPRIESNGEGGYHFIVAGREDSWLTGAEYTALCEIAGHRLPVYEGGKWEQIMEGVGEHTASDVLHLPIWRYRR